MEKIPTSLLIPAAGQASRMGKKRNKQYIILAGKPVLAHTLHAFLSLGRFSPIGILVAPGEKDMFRKWVLNPFVPEDEDIFVVEGGQERQYTVYNGLVALQQKRFPPEGIVCVHDGARPFIRGELIESVCAAAWQYGAAVCGVPLKDTIKQVGQDGDVLATPPRESFVAVQTPQCFRFSLLWEAHVKAKEKKLVGSDDAMLVEMIGGQVKVVPGIEDNIKLTTPMDLVTAEIILKERCTDEVESEIDRQFGSGWGPDCR